MRSDGAGAKDWFLMTGWKLLAGKLNRTWVKNEVLVWMKILRAVPALIKCFACRTVDRALEGNVWRKRSCEGKHRVEWEKREPVIGKSEKRDSWTWKGGQEVKRTANDDLPVWQSD